MDSIVTKVINRFKTRAEIGNKKYGTDLDRNDLTVLEWIQHLQDELHDAYLYSEKLKTDYTEEIKQLMYKWVKEEKLNGANMPIEVFMASFTAYLNKNKQ